MFEGGGSHGVNPHPVLRQVFGALDEHGIPWCLLRGEDELDRPAGDVDLLLRREDRNRVRTLFEGLGWAPIPAWGFGDHRFFLFYDVDRGDWLKLDIVSSLAFGPDFSMRIDGVVSLLDRRRRFGAVTVLHPDDAFWALLCHSLLDKGDVGGRDRPKLAQLVSEAVTTGPMARAIDALAVPGCRAQDLIDHVAAARWRALADAAPLLRARWRRHLGDPAFLLALRHGLSRVLAKANRLRQRPGVMVAFLAPDGAGKTTLIEALQTSIPLPVAVSHMGLYRDGPVGSRLPGLGTAMVISRLWGRWLRCARRAARGCIVLFDRYPYDALLPVATTAKKKSLIRRRLLGRSLPRPSLVVVLDAPAEVLHARKGEKTVARLHAEGTAYQALASRLPDATVVDASRAPDELLREVTGLIWERLASGWRRSFRS